MTLEKLKHSATEENRIRGARFNVDFKTASADTYTEVLATPKTAPVRPIANIGALDALELNAQSPVVSRRMSNESSDELARLKAKLKEKDALLEEKERELQQTRSELEHAIASKMQSLIQSQAEIAKLKEMLRG